MPKQKKKSKAKPKPKLAPKQVGKMVSDAKNGVEPDLEGAKVKEKDPKSGLVTVEKVGKVFDAVLKNAADWEKRANPELSYQYYETNQIPERLKAAEDIFFVQLNLIRDAQDTRMGLFSSSPIEWGVTGSGPDKRDRGRIKLHRHVCEWAAREMSLKEQIRRALFDYSLHGMGWLRLLWDAYFLTSINTIGMATVKKLNSLHTHPAVKSRDGNALDGNHVLNYERLTEEEFNDEYDGVILPSNKQADASKIFASIEDPEHFDHKLNQKLNLIDDGKAITVIDYEYKRFRKLTYNLGGEEIRIPLREFRQSYIAGKTKLLDEKSGIDNLQFFSKILIANEPMHDSCYSSSAFQAEKEMQDLINTMLSMSVGNQAGQITSPWKALEGSLINEDMWNKSASAFNGILKWKYTKAMKETGIPVGAAEPKRDRPGAFDAGWFALMQWVFARFDAVSVKDVVKGINQPGVQSGKHAAILNAQGMQPTVYQREKIEPPLARLGAGIHHYLVEKLDGEMEIPIEDNDSEADGVVINHILTNKELAEVMEKPEEELEETLDMCSVSIDDNGKTKRIGWKEFMEEEGISYQTLAAGAVNGKFQIVKNDLKFGNFRAAITIDPRAEATKIERMARADQVSEMLLGLGAGMGALKYTLNAHGDPNAKEVIDETKKEIKGLQLGRKLLAITEKAREAVEDSGGDPSQLPEPIQMLLSMAEEIDED